MALNIIAIPVHFLSKEYIMRYIIISTVIAIISGVAYAACTTSTVIQPDGRVTVCSTCCDANNNCTVICTPN